MGQRQGALARLALTGLVPVLASKAVLEPDDPTAKKSPRRWIRPVVGLGLTCFFLWLIGSRLDLSELPGRLAEVDGSLACLGALSLALGYAARITRWWLMLRLWAPSLRWSEAAGPFLVSIAANNLLPLRAGDVMRVFAFGGRNGLGASRVGGTLIVERLSDLFVLLLIIALVLPFAPVGGVAGSIMSLAAWAAGFGAVALLLVFCLPLVQRRVLPRIGALRWVRASPLAVRALELISTLVDAMVSLGGPRRLATIAVLSLVAWVFEAGVFIAAQAATGLGGDLAAGFFALAVATLATLLPSSPGYVGTFHYFAMQAVIVFGAPEASAAVFAIVAHLLVWLPTTLAGVAVFALTMFRGKAPSFRLAQRPLDRNGS